MGDYLSGLYGCLGILMALRYRDLTGRGQYIDVALYESVFRCTEELAPAYAMYGTVRERHGPHIESACPYGHFPTKDGKWVALACTTDKLFARLAEAMERPELASSSLYGEHKARMESRHDVNEIVRDWCGSLTREQVLERCYATGAPAGPLNNIADIFGDRHVHARRNLVAVDVADLGETVIVPQTIPRLSETPGRMRHLGKREGFAMAAAVGLREDYEATQLRALAKRSADANQTRRLLALAAIYDGGSRGEAARIGGVGLQTVRDWVLAFNAEGPPGLVNGTAPGNPPLLDPGAPSGVARDRRARPDLGG